MHILLIHQAFAALDEPGGTRHYEMAQYFASKGHKVTIISSPVSYLTGKSRQSKSSWVTREEPEKNITILRAYTYPALHKSFIHRVFSFVSFMFSSFFIGLGIKKVDIVWGTTPPIFQAWTAWLVARLKRKPVVLEVRDLWPAFAVAVGVLKNRTLIYLSEWLEKFLYKHADHVVVNSPGFIHHVSERGAKNITLVENGVDPAMFDPKFDGTLFRENHNLQGKFVILYAGAHGLSNDLEVVLQAAKETQREKDLIYLFVGDGKEKEHLVRLAADWSLENVVFLPSVPKNQMAEVVAAADACIAILKPIDLYKTTYPNKVFDYMAAGKPVVLAIDGVIREVVEKANCGVFVKPGNAEEMAEAIINLKKDKETTRKKGKNGRDYVIQFFSRSSLAEKIVKLFELMVKKNG
jgi:glycosyltransferase involved in cell wall biosynthesis